MIKLGRTFREIFPNHQLPHLRQARQVHGGKNKVHGGSWSKTDLAHREKKVKVPAGSPGQSQALQYLTEHKPGEFQPCLQRAEKTMQLPVVFASLFVNTPVL